MRDLVLAQLSHRHLDDIGESIPVENVGDGISDVEHQDAETTMFFVRTTAFAISGLADTGNRGERSIDQPCYLTHRNVFRGPSQQIAAVFTALALQVAGGLELHQDLFQKFDWEPFLGCQFAHLEQRTPDGLGYTEINQSAQGIFAPFRQLHDSEY